MKLRKTWCIDWAYQSCDDLIGFAWNTLPDGIGSELLDKLETLENDDIKRRFHIETVLSIAELIAEETTSDEALQRCEYLIEEIEHIKSEWKSTGSKHDPKTTGDTLTTSISPTNHRAKYNSGTSKKKAS